MAEKLILERLKTVVEAYGARPERWPEDERDTLLAALGDHRDASFIAEARSLDALLDAVPAVGMSPALADRIVAAAVGEAQADPGKVVLALPAWVARAAPVAEAALLAASLAAGLWLGSAGIGESWFAMLQADNLVTTASVGPDEANFLAAVDADALAY